MSEITQEIREAAAVAKVVGSTGWSFIQKYLDNRIETLIADLTSCPTDEILQKRGQLKEVREFLNWVNERLETYKEKKQ